MKFNKINNFIPPKSKKPPTTNKWPKWQEFRKKAIWISNRGTHNILATMDGNHIYNATKKVNFFQSNTVWCGYKYEQWEKYFIKELKFRSKFLNDNLADEYLTRLRHEI